MKKMKKLFIDLWEGKIALWKTYWYLTLAGLIYYLPIYFLVPEDRYSVFAFTEVFSLFYIVFFLIVVWRSANKYKGKKIWYFLAKFSAIIFVIMQLFSAFQYGNFFQLS